MAIDILKKNCWLKSDLRFVYLDSIFFPFLEFFSEVRDCFCQVFVLTRFVDHVKDLWQLADLNSLVKAINDIFGGFIELKKCFDNNSEEMVMFGKAWERDKQMNWVYPFARVSMHAASKI